MDSKRKCTPDFVEGTCLVIWTDKIRIGCVRSCHCSAAYCCRICRILSCNCAVSNRSWVLHWIYRSSISRSDCSIANRAWWLSLIYRCAVSYHLNVRSVVCCWFVSAWNYVLTSCVVCLIWNINRVLCRRRTGILSRYIILIALCTIVRMQLT